MGRWACLFQPQGLNLWPGAPGRFSGRGSGVRLGLLARGRGSLLEVQASYGKRQFAGIPLFVLP